MIDKLKAANYIENKLGKPFIWGQNDCNTFIVEYFDKMLNTNLLEIIYKKYSTKAEAIKFQKEFGQRISGRCLELGLKEFHPANAIYGDILVKHNENWDSCHICVGNKIASIDEKEGTFITPISSFFLFDHAYRIGNEN
tara:strand:- start:863 stop:1279 length:417 start_codon:yes stop_codon:yes gene_type:complete